MKQASHVVSTTRARSGDITPSKGAEATPSMSVQYQRTQSAGGGA